MPRFAIVSHTPGPNSSYPFHYDLFLQLDDKLASWRLPEIISEQTTTLDAVQTQPHRLSYLDFEGELSESRGAVRTIMKGTVQYLLVSNSEIIASISSATVQFLLSLQANKPPLWALKMQSWTPKG